MPRNLTYDQKMTERLLIRLTPQQKQAIEDDAQRRGMTLADHVRRIMLMVANREVLVR